MKCVARFEDPTGKGIRDFTVRVVRRVSNKHAAHLVTNEGWHFVNKSTHKAWKRNGRKDVMKKLLNAIPTKNLPQ